MKSEIEKLSPPFMNLTIGSLKYLSILANISVLVTYVYKPSLFVTHL